MQCNKKESVISIANSPVPSNNHDLSTAPLRALLRSVQVVMRGGGDLATGVAYRLHSAGFPLLVLELAQPLVVRRPVAVASAIAAGEIAIEGMHAEHIVSLRSARATTDGGRVAVLVAPELPHFEPRPTVLIDARMAKEKQDTTRDQAELVIALGPGFEAGRDCHVVVETMRGHTLGRAYWQGSALPDTGCPGRVAGKSRDRVLRAANSGEVHWRVDSGDTVVSGDTLGHVGGTRLEAAFDGVVRGLIAEGFAAWRGLKIGDIDARLDRTACFTISDKSLAVGGGVLHAILDWLNR